MVRDGDGVREEIVPRLRNMETVMLLLLVLDHCPRSTVTDGNKPYPAGYVWYINGYK